MAQSLNFDVLDELYFAYDEPVPYALKSGATLNIYPIALRDSLIFLTSCDLLNIDKNSSSDVKVIQMTYLRYLNDIVIQNADEQEAKASKQKLVNICMLCFKFEMPYLGKDERGKIILGDAKNPDIIITEKEFDDIRRIIMYQNILDYDDEYINPDLKKAIDETNALKAARYAPISTARKMGIVMAHSGYTKQQLKDMTYRSFNILFNEVVGEVEFETTRVISLYAGQGDKIEHWIFKKRKDKFDDYIHPLDEYAKSMGADSQGNIRGQTKTDRGDGLDAMFNEMQNK